MHFITFSLLFLALAISKKEDQEWIWLFDGTSTEAWRGIYLEDFPDGGWEVVDRELRVIPSTEATRPDRGGAIITRDVFSNFELVLEFKLDSGTNSGIKYFVNETEPATPKRGIGLEYQLWDDDQPREKKHHLADVYDLYIARGKKAWDVTRFHEARIRVVDGNVEHWLDGEPVVRFDRFSKDFADRVANSKYHSFKGFGAWESGHILLQDEGGPGVAFRNIRIRRL